MRISIIFTNNDNPENKPRPIIMFDELRISELFNLEEIEDVADGVEEEAEVNVLLSEVVVIELLT